MILGAIIICGLVGLFCYTWGYANGMKSNGKFQIRIGGSNNTQVMK